MNSNISHTSDISLSNAAWRLLRPKQWIKNFFVFAPLIFASQFLNETAVYASLGAFILFSVAASATYVLNDIKDIENDRLHPKKSKERPLAAGWISPPQAWGLWAVLVTITLSGFIWLPDVMLIIIGYLLLNIAYSIYLKHQPVLDIFTIATGFVLRVYAGATAISVPVSSWMFVTTFSLALFLAAIKRQQELINLGDQARSVLKVYSVATVERFAEMSATGALVFYSFFVMSARPELVITVPFVLFGLFRYFYISEQLNIGESPTEALINDKQLLITVVGWVGTSLWALWPA